MSRKYIRFSLLRTFFLAFLLSYFGNLGAFAQVVSTEGDFEVDFNVGCNPLNVEVDLLFSGSVGSVQYIYDNTIDPESCPDKNNPSCYNGTTLTPDTRFAFNEPGVYYIIQIIATATDPRLDYVRIEVFDNLTKPEVTINNCLGNTMEIVFNKDLDPFDFYQINFKDGNITQQYSNWSGDQPIIYTFNTTGSSSISIIGMFNNGNSSSCSSPPYTILSFETLPTPVLEAISVNDENEIEIEYQELTSGFNYNLQVDKGSGFEDLTSVDPDANPTSILLNDPEFNTSTNTYAFKLIVEDICSTDTEESAIGHSIAFSISDEVINNNIDITFSWLTGSQNFNSIDLLVDDATIQTFTTPQSQPNQSISFSNCTQLGDFSMVTVINNVVSTSVVITPFDGLPYTLPAPLPPLAEINGAVVTIGLPSTNFPLSNYILHRKDIDNDFNEVFTTSSNQITDTTIPPGTGQVCYKVSYIDECGNISALSDEICLVLSTNLGIPNAFSPNGDGINDEFKISDGIYNNFVLMIYNRWGNLIFNSNDPSIGWDGNFDGQPVNSGTYRYKLSFQNADNLTISKTGSFILIR